MQQNVNEIIHRVTLPFSSSRNSLNPYNEAIEASKNNYQPLHWCGQRIKLAEMCHRLDSLIKTQYCICNVAAKNGNLIIRTETLKMQN